MSYQILNPNSANYAATVSSNETARMRTMIQEITGLQNNTAASFTGGISLESMSKARISNKVSKDNESAMNQLGSALAESLKGSTFFVSTENFDKASSEGGVKMKIEFVFASCLTMRQAAILFCIAINKLDLKTRAIIADNFFGIHFEVC